MKYSNYTDPDSFPNNERIVPVSLSITKSTVMTMATLFLQL